MKKSNKTLVYGGLFLLSLVVAAGLYSVISPASQKISESVAETQEQKLAISTKSKMTEFDIQLARKLMDKDNDGRCDFCPMDLNLCIDSGMLECTMNPKAKIGLLDSDHIHADFKVYLNGEMVDFNQKKYFVKSAFAHVESEENNEETGNVLHIHAKGVPLWLFFESLRMQFSSECFKLEDAQFCNNDNSKLRVFVNGAENNQFGDYVPKSLDKILITYGIRGNEVKKQINSITDYAKNH
jgi:hypothetical protein